MVDLSKVLLSVLSSLICVYMKNCHKDDNRYLVISGRNSLKKTSIDTSASKPILDTIMKILPSVLDLSPYLGDFEAR